jgi:hypothetical protein
MPCPNADLRSVKVSGMRLGVRSSGYVRVALAVFMRTGFEAWWVSVSALVSRRITVAWERWMRAMDWKPCRADRIVYAWLRGEDDVFRWKSWVRSYPQHA